MSNKKNINIFTIYETRTQLSKLLKRVRAGQEIIISHGSTPIAKIVPLSTPTQPRKPGSAKGGFIMSPDFDSPLSEELISQFYK